MSERQLRQLIMGGEYATEADAWADFDSRAAVCGCFKIYREVSGEIMQPRHGVEFKAVRIDRILVPSPKLLEAGWRHGPLGVEGKRSGEKAGPAIAQAMDYGRSVFDLGTAQSQLPTPSALPGFLIMLQWVFLWPLNPDPGDIVSLMMQNRIGTVHVGDSNRFSLLFRADAMHAIEVYVDGTVKAKILPMGRKAGSR